MPNEVKEVDVFRKYSKNNKQVIIIIAVCIAVVLFAIAYFTAKSLFTYTVTFNTNGGTEVAPYELKFLQRIEEPNVKVKKTGFYLVRWYNDNSNKTTFNFGGRIWNNLTICAEWEEGFALVLHYAEGEETTDLPLKDLKDIYEEYFKDGSTIYLPEVYNTNRLSEHFGERLLWFETPDCTGEPLMEKSYVLKGQDIHVYGKWFDTREDKFEVDTNGVLQRYLGHCNRIILPSNIKSIKDVNVDNFVASEPSGYVENDDPYHSAFCNVISELEIIYLNAELEKLGECSFKDCEALKYVIFSGNNLTLIGAYSFQGCTGLNNIILPDGVREIGTKAFHSAGIETITIPNSLTTIRDGAFMDSKLKSCALPNVSLIEKLAFASCVKLTEITLSSPIMISTNADNNLNNIFLGSGPTGNFVIKVPENLLSTYKTTNPWSMYSDKYQEI